MRYKILIILILAVFSLSACNIPANREPEVTNGQTDGDSSGDTESGIGDETEILENEIKAAGNSLEKERDLLETDNNRKNWISVILYYQDKNGYLIPVTRWVPKQQSIARAAINGLIDKPVNREDVGYYGLYPVLPKNTEVLGINIKNGIATIDFNRGILEYNSEITELNIVSSVVYTLTQFKTIDKVIIWVNGYDNVKLKYANDISGIFDRKNTMINSGRQKAEIGKSKYDVYYLKKLNLDRSFLVPVSFETGSLEEIPAGEIIQRLSAKAYQDGIYSELPGDIKLLDMGLDNGKIRVEISEDIMNYSGAEREDDILGQLLFSFKQFDDYEKIDFKVNGARAVLPEGSNVSEYMKTPVRINDFID